jgi:hypothetical protein
MFYKIPVFAHTDETFGFIEIGMEYPMTDCDIRHRYFINIDSVGEYVDKVGRVTYGTVCSGGNEYITSLSLEELLNLVNPPKVCRAS